MRTLKINCILTLFCIVPNIVLADINQFQHCNALIQHGMQDIQTKFTADTATGYNYHKYCRTTSSVLSEAALSEAETSIFGFGDGSGSFNRTRSEKKLDSFCETNKNIASKSSMLYSKAAKYSGPALAAWNQCQQAAKKLVKINLTHRSEDATKLTFTIDSTQDGTLYLTGVEQKAYTCNLYHTKNTKKTEIQPDDTKKNAGISEYSFTNIPINNQNIHIGCSRNKANITSGNEIKTLKYEEGSVSIFTSGPSFSISVPEITEDYHHTPKNSVLAFALDPIEGCPAGWIPYEQAYGRFIRGIDPTGSTETDPDGTRNHGTPQEDLFKSHQHNLPNNNPYPSGAGGGPHSPWVVSNGTGQTGSPVGSSGRETRPKNVALLYCIKQ